ncbi:hypothetical protein BD769DRAFT_1392902 [Suillus cothurnatus]|nr:hypothetical protein BD769DRAFT_1392902 [Suillus cothurnatus]
MYSVLVCVILIRTQQTYSPRTTTLSTIVRQCTRAQTAAYLLGIHPELPDIIDTAEQYQAPAGEVDKRAKRLYIFDSIKAIMDVPELYEHLAWRLSTARRTDPPHRLLTVHDIDSAFRAARAESSERQHKKVAIEIVNTEPTPKEKPTKQRAVPQPLKRTYALYLENAGESSNDEPLQGIEDVVTNVHSRYPAMKFSHFNSGFYKEKIGMSEGAAYTFHSYVENAYIKAEHRKRGRSAKGKKARASG